MTSIELDIVDEDTDHEMTHIRSFAEGKTLCGFAKDTSRPPRWDGRIDCVVCESLWMGMTENEQYALCIRWGWKG